jgi:hypothetical protein
VNLPLNFFGSRQHRRLFLPDLRHQNAPSTDTLLVRVLLKFVMDLQRNVREKPSRAVTFVMALKPSNALVAGVMTA